MSKNHLKVPKKGNRPTIAPKKQQKYEAIDIGNMIKNMRTDEQLTQEVFSKRVGISRSYLGDLENNRKSPSVETLQKLATALNKKLKFDFI